MKRSSGPAEGHEDQHEVDLTQVHLDRPDMEVLSTTLEEHTPSPWVI
jgi:hypothetical protein